MAVQQKRADMAAQKRSLPQRKPLSGVLVFLVVCACVIALDQATKAYLRSVLSPGVAVSFIPHIMDLCLTHNTGAAFSLGEGAGMLFVGIAAIVWVAGLWFSWHETTAPWPLLVCVSLVCAGGISNGIDRVVFGYVTDFFKTTFIHFAVFNVADIFITCGVFAGIFLWWIWDSRQEKAVADVGSNPATPGPDPATPGPDPATPGSDLAEEAQNRDAHGDL